MSIREAILHEVESRALFLYHNPQRHPQAKAFKQVLSKRADKYTEEDHAILRDVALDPFIPGHLPRPFRLTVWDTYTRDHYGKSRLGYRMVSPEGIVLFESEDFCCSPCVAVRKSRWKTCI